MSTVPDMPAGGETTIYPWQRPAWRSIAALRAHWPHALLVHGQPGIGKVDFARFVAQSLLCESPREDGAACGACAACRWFAADNHPDFRLVCPESVAAPAGEAPVDESRKGRAPSREIKIEQVRALLDFCTLGSHRQGWRVALLYPAEALNAASANALLKTLEEPPPGVVFLLVADYPDRLLPTIVSRCRLWPMSAPTRAEALAWLTAQAGPGGDAAARAVVALAEAGGAPLGARRLLRRAAEETAAQRLLLAQLAAGAECDAFGCAEALQRTAVPLVLGWLQRWLWDLAAQHALAAPRYYPFAADALSRCAAALDGVRLARYVRAVNGQRASEHHPLNARLVFESVFLAYRDLYAPAP
jgi:DNA polymerase-3 subunit delta'